MRLAERLRELRQKNGWSLDELTTRSGVSRATLSRLEHADVSPTAMALSRVAAAYGLPVSRLVRMAEQDSVEKIALAEQPAETDEATGAVHRQISPRGGVFSIEVGEHVLPPGQKGAILTGARDGGEQQVLVLEGRLKVHRSGGVHVLRKGDLLRFHDDGATTLSTGGKRAARFLVISA